MATDATDRSSVSTTRLHLYVSSGRFIYRWWIDGRTGDLGRREACDVGGEVGPMAIAPDHRHIYVGLRDERSIAVYAVDGSTGTLAYVAKVHTGLRPVYVHVDGTGENLLVASFHDDAIAVYRIAEDGRLQEAPTESCTVASRPHCIVTDPSNRFVFVPHRDANIIRQFIFDAAKGTLSPNTPPDAEAPAGVGPRHIVFHPDVTHAYVSNEFGSSVSTYAYDVETGRLRCVDTVAALPADVANAENTGADVHITPDGRFVYMSNRGHDSLAVFAVDPTTKTLSPRGHAQTVKTPREFGLDPLGRFAFAVSQHSGALASYAIGREGDLTRLGVIDAEPSGMWVLAVMLP